MELKNKKTKAKAKVKGKIHTIPENNNTDTFIQKNESIFIQEIETQDDFLDLPVNTILETTVETNKKSFLTYIPWILLIIFSVSSFYLWSQLSDIKKDPLMAINADSTKIINLVGKIMLLPKDESPQVTTLTDDDLGKVKAESFFMHANAGDKVLIYNVAKRVILYNPKINKIIEVANLGSENSPKL